jgi:predicted RNA binding protein YcfA (HicA-like mRNA interferase family)
VTPPAGKEFCAFLMHNGWILARPKGSHHVQKKPGVMALLTVPVHGGMPLKLGLFHALLTQSGLRWP